MNFTSSKISELVGILDGIKSFESLSKEKFGSSEVAAYYKKLGYLYRRYHSRDGAMHMPIKTSETEKHTHKLLFQARSVEKLIKDHNYKSVIELGCGYGFNSIYLARIFPDVQFVAMDLTDSNLELASAKGKDLTNLSFRKFNFNEDEHLYNADLVFGVETACYARSLTSLCKNIVACLSDGGRIVIIDGYERHPRHYSALTRDEEKAYQLVCWGFALNRFQSLQQVYDAAKSNDLSIELEGDLTQEILPNYKIFEQGSLKLLSYPLLAKLLLFLKIVPRVVYLHTIAGLFGAYLMERNFFSYYQFVLKKNDSGPEIMICEK